MRLLNILFDLSRHFDLSRNYWQDYLPFLKQLEGKRFPNCTQLNSYLPASLLSEGGHPIRFVPSSTLADDAYEHRIYTSGQVSTRKDSWHDLFNALVWMRFPTIKTAMNALHYRAGSLNTQGSRGSLRDALTLFDECGVIVFSSQLELLQTLARHQWSLAFQDLKTHWGTNLQITICGHAMLEKFLSPYKAMTAKALLIHVDPSHDLPNRDNMLELLDQVIAKQLLAGSTLTRPECLAPLPLAGIPGWWPEGEQDDDFYADRNVFRPPKANKPPAPVFRLP